MVSPARPNVHCAVVVVLVLLTDVEQAVRVGSGGVEGQVAVVQAGGALAGEGVGVALTGAVGFADVEEQHAGALKVAGERDGGGVPVGVVEQVVEHAAAGDRVESGSQEASSSSVRYPRRARPAAWRPVPQPASRTRAGAVIPAASRVALTMSVHGCTDR